MKRHAMLRNQSATFTVWNGCDAQFEAVFRFEARVRCNTKLTYIAPHASHSSATSIRGLGSLPAKEA